MVSSKPAQRLCASVGPEHLLILCGVLGGKNLVTTFWVDLKKLECGFP